MPEETTRVRAIVRGRVQGVWFRQSTFAEAVRLGLAGWVRNLPDGSVEVVFEGPGLAVEQALSYVAVGPERARVDSVDSARETPAGEVGFRVR
ncbi:MAG: acylphosphatase [Coriobacteriia bacterium]|nr:acylphosphatase [Coriobacteriia bacterium]